MCQPKSKGGQRCHGHARDRFDRAVARLNKARSAPGGHGYGDAHDQWMRAGAELASTEQGLTEIRALADEMRTIWRHEQGADLYDQMAERGELLRERNAAVRTAAHRPSRRLFRRASARGGAYTLTYAGDMNVSISAPDYDSAREQAQRAANESGAPVVLGTHHDPLFTARPQ